MTELVQEHSTRNVNTNEGCYIHTSTRGNMTVIEQVIWGRYARTKRNTRNVQKWKHMD